MARFKQAPRARSITHGELPQDGLRTNLRLELCDHHAQFVSTQNPKDKELCRPVLFTRWERKLPSGDLLTL
jgi:hypothetical protein